MTSQGCPVKSGTLENERKEEERVERDAITLEEGRKSKFLLPKLSTTDLFDRHPPTRSGWAEGMPPSVSASSLSSLRRSLALRGLISFLAGKRGGGRGIRTRRDLPSA